MSSTKRVVAHLTDKAIKAAKPVTSETKTNADGSPKLMVARIRDGKETGLNLTVTPAGSKSFYFQFSSPEINKRRFKKLGDYPQMSLESARIEARNCQNLIRVGIDPIQAEEMVAKQAQVAQLKKKHKAEQKIANKLSGTVDVLFELYEADLEMDGKLTKEMVAAYHKDIAPFIAGRKAHKITSDDIADILAAIHARKAYRKSGVVRGYLHRAFSLGMEAPYSPRWTFSDKTEKDDPHYDLKVKAQAFKKLTYNPVTRIKNAEGKSRPGNHVLTESEIKKFWHEAGTSIMRSDSALAIKLTLATGQRVTEILHARWDEFDIEGQEWAIPMTRRKIRHKAQHQEPHTVPLCDFHIDLLNDLRALTGNSEFLFPNNAGDKPRTHNSLQQAVVRYCEHAAKIDKEQGTSTMRRFSPRDLRRTMKTLGAKAEIQKEVLDRIQGHAFQDVASKNYLRYDFWKEKKEGMQLWCIVLDHMVNNANVVPMRKKA